MATTPGYTAGTTATTAETVVPDDSRTHLRNRVSWGAILAGVVAALVTQLLLNILGVCIGLSALDAANAADNPSASSFSTTGATVSPSSDRTRTRLSTEV